MRIYSDHNILIAAGRLNLATQKSKKSEPWVGEFREINNKKMSSTVVSVRYLAPDHSQNSESEFLAYPQLWYQNRRMKNNFKGVWAEE